MNKGAEYRVGIGASSILMIFIILSLTTLGVLSFASARADLALTARKQKQIEAYYTTTAEAQALIAQIDEALLKAQADPETYDTEVRALRSMDDRISVGMDMTISLALPVGDTQQLRVKLQPNGAEDAERYTVMAHYLVNVENWQPDNSITLKTSED